jgi:molybdenum cofactor cytidylyltransferase
VNIVYNAGWNEGMSSAIRKGISALIKTDPKIQSAILMLCDQPLMDTYVLNHLIMANNAGGIAASGYNDTIGPPVLFDVIYFNDLLALKGSDGAKKVIQQYPGKIVNVLFPQGDIDIDTMEDFQKLSQL